MHLICIFFNLHKWVLDLSSLSISLRRKHGIISRWSYNLRLPLIAFIVISSEWISIGKSPKTMQSVGNVGSDWKSLPSAFAKESIYVCVRVTCELLNTWIFSRKSSIDMWRTRSKRGVTSFPCIRDHCSVICLVSSTHYDFNCEYVEDKAIRSEMSSTSNYRIIIYTTNA